MVVFIFVFKMVYLIVNEASQGLYSRKCIQSITESSRFAVSIGLPDYMERSSGVGVWCAPLLP